MYDLFFRRYVIANDLSPAAVEAIKRNVELNDLHEREAPVATTAVVKTAEEPEGSVAQQEGKEKPPKKILAKVRINEGDAWYVALLYSDLSIYEGLTWDGTYSSLMYSHRSEKLRVDCVDLDPYGTAAPFIDAAVQSVHDGGQ